MPTESDFRHAFRQAEQQLEQTPLNGNLRYDTPAVEVIAVGPPMSITDLKQTLAQLRLTEELLAGTLAETQALVDRQKAELQKQHDLENATIFYNLLAVQTEKNATELELRESLIAWCQETGQKTYDEDCGVAVKVTYSYDSKLALEWCEKNAPALIVKSVNEKPFVALVTKLDEPPEFVVPTPTFIAKIAKDLNHLVEAK